ncbi:hypothetical protein Aduo_019877 [Ancylostoma duodenale]
MLDDPISRSYELIRKQEDGDSMSVDISEEMNDTEKRKVKQMQWFLGDRPVDEGGSETHCFSWTIFIHVNFLDP